MHVDEKMRETNKEMDYMKYQESVGTKVEMRDGDDDEEDRR